MTPAINPAPNRKAAFNFISTGTANRVPSQTAHDESVDAMTSQKPSRSLQSSPVSRIVATTAHFGPYQRLKDAHGAIREWCARHGHRFSGTSWEIYGHWEESWNNDPSKIRTDVFHLLLDSKT